MEANSTQSAKSSSDAIQIRRSAKAKRLRLAVKPGLIELVVPRGMAESHALAFLDKHKAWAEGKLLELNDKLSRVRPVESFTACPTIPWRGKDIPLFVQEGSRGRVKITVDETVQIMLPQGLGEARDEVALRAFYAWVCRWLRVRVALLAERHALRCNLHHREIRIKHMKTRWGSCGPRNDININWLLALAPESVLEYVVIHELCHIAERNHSPAFWSLVGKHYPKYAEERRWLKFHGGDLMRRFNI